MLTAEQVLNYQFSKAGMNGYRAAEVDQLLTEVTEALSFYEKTTERLQQKIEELKKNETIIQDTLVNAQKLATQITEEAQAKADALLAEAQTKADAASSDSQAQIAETSAKAEKAVRDMIAAAEERSAAMLEKAKKTADALERENRARCQDQEKLLAKMKNEVAAFRAALMAQYREHIRLIEALPDEFVPTPADQAEEEPVLDSGSQLTQIFDEMQANEAAAADAVDAVAAMTAEPEKPAPVEAKPIHTGFSVTIDD